MKKIGFFTSWVLGFLMAVTLFVSPQAVGVNWLLMSSALAAAWGTITGTLSDQSDLNTQLGLKAPLASPTFSGTVTVPSVNFTGSDRVRVGTSGHDGTLDYFGSTIFKWGNGGGGPTSGNVWFPYTDDSSDLGFQGSSRWRVAYLSRGVQLETTGSQPTCNSTNRGRQWSVRGGAGVADIFQVCEKDAADVYGWVTK